MLTMPNIKSAKKRVEVLERRKVENKLVKSSLATSIKKFKLAIDASLEDSDKKLSEICSIIDAAESRGVIHSNCANRKKARMAQYINRAKAKTETK